MMYRGIRNSLSGVPHMVGYYKKATVDCITSEQNCNNVQHKFNTNYLVDEEERKKTLKSN